MKECNNCKEIKNPSAFEYSIRSKNTVRNTCKVCRNKRRKLLESRQRLGLRKHYVQRRYNTSLEEIESMVLIQDNKCYLCCSPPDNRWNVLAIDHDHKTGKIRKLLCDSCNRGLGQFKDNIDILYKAIDYLKIHS